MTARCSSCRRPIEWALTEAGKRIPLDPAPVPDGNLVIERRDLDGTPHVRYLTKAGADLFTDANAERRVTHFATCPNAKAHRR